MKKKLLIFTNCYIFGGCERIILGLAQNELIRADFDVTFSYAYNKDYEKIFKLNRDPQLRYVKLFLLWNENLFIRLGKVSKKSGLAKIWLVFIKLFFTSLRKSGLYTLYNFIVLYFFLIKNKPDIFHINNGGYPAAFTCLIAVFAAKLAGVKKIVFNVHNVASCQRGALDKVIDKKIADYVNVFVTASQIARTQLNVRRKIPLEKITQIYNWTTEVQITIIENVVKKEFAKNENCFLIVVVAYLSVRKGQLELLKAFNAIKEKEPEVFGEFVLLLVGNGEDEKQIVDYINKNGLSKNALLTGYREDYLNFVNAADLFILPSLSHEDMPLVVLDAMRLKKTIISTNVSGIVEQIRNGIDGILVEPSHVHLLSETIVKLYHDENMRMSMANSAATRYQELFTCANSISKYHAIYQNLVNEV